MLEQLVPLSTKQLAVPTKRYSSLLKQRACSKRHEPNWPKLQVLKLVLLAISTQTIHDSLQQATVCSEPRPTVAMRPLRPKHLVIILANSPTV